MLISNFSYLCLIVALKTSQGVESEIQEETSANSVAENTNKVLICLENDKNLAYELNDAVVDILPKVSFEYCNMEACSDMVSNNLTHSLLAVIAPKVLEKLDYSEVPTYFYDEPYIMREYLDVFPNAIAPTEQWRMLKHAFTRFFEEQDWIRIAIISDNSWFSAAFEEDLVAHFQKKGVVYHVERCLQVSQLETCDFDEAVKFIKVNRALIVIANVGAENAAALLAAARAHGATRPIFAWLARDRTLSRALAQEIGSVLLFTVAPKLEQGYSVKMPTGVDLPRLTSILHGVSLIAEAVRNIEKKNKMEYYYRDIARRMTARKVENQVYIQKITALNTTVITIGTFRGHDVKFSSGPPAFSSKIYDVEDCFLMRSEVFLSPCNDTLILIVVLVLVMTVVMMLLLAYFFKYLDDRASGEYDFS